MVNNIYKLFIKSYSIYNDQNEINQILYRDYLVFLINNNVVFENYIIYIMYNIIL